MTALTSKPGASELSSFERLEHVAIYAAVLVTALLASLFSKFR